MRAGPLGEQNLQAKEWVLGEGLRLLSETNLDNVDIMKEWWTNA